MKLWNIPPQYLDIEILVQEHKDLSELCSQMYDKFHGKQFKGRSPLMRKYYPYSMFPFLRLKVIEKEILYRDFHDIILIPDIIAIPSPETIYPFKREHISNDVECLYDVWQKNNTISPYIEKLSYADVNKLYSELVFIYSIFKRSLL